ncbi:hypothetical protein N9007_01160 [bacterium]|nr:hypothetical protein [bacterium]MDB4460338.1 hypothetical protein [bacterium]
MADGLFEQKKQSNADGIRVFAVLATQHWLELLAEVLLKDWPLGKRRL